jgi:hypothetical protein
MKFSPITKRSGARKQLRAMPGGSKVRSIQSSMLGAVVPVEPTPPIEMAPTKPSGQVVTPEMVKMCCGISIAKARGAKCSKCGTAWGQIASPIGTFRSFARWSQKVLPPAQRKSWVTSPMGATWPGGGVWMTTAQLSAATAFMQQGGKL